MWQLVAFAALTAAASPTRSELASGTSTMRPRFVSHRAPSQAAAEDLQARAETMNALAMRPRHEPPGAMAEMERRHRRLWATTGSRKILYGKP